MLSKRLAGALALAALAPALGGKDLPPPPSAAGLVVRAGRATLVQGEEIVVLTRAAARRSVVGEAYAEVGALGELELAWPGVGSLRVRGPAALEWDAAGDLRMLRAERFELEVRRGERRLHLPGGWTLEARRGALGGTEHATGDWTVENRGGADAGVLRDGEERGALASGRQVVLPLGRPDGD